MTTNSNPAQPADKGRVKYAPENARSYQAQRPGKDRAELRLVERCFRLIPKGRVLDVPCGGERVSKLLAKKHPTSLREVRGHFEAAEFRLANDFARMPLIHTLRLALFERCDVKP